MWFEGDKKFKEILMLIWEFGDIKNGRKQFLSWSLSQNKNFLLAWESFDLDRFRVFFVCSGWEPDFVFFEKWNLDFKKKVSKFQEISWKKTCKFVLFRKRVISFSLKIFPEVL